VNGPAESEDSRHHKLTSIVTKGRKKAAPGSAVMHIESVDRSFRWVYNDGLASRSGTTPFGTSSPFFIASTTKLFVSTLVLQLIESGALTLDTHLVDVVTTENLVGIHRVGDEDHTRHITVRQLLSHTSGLANYLEDKRTDGSVLLQKALRPGGDRSWTRNDIYQWHRTVLKNPRVPGLQKTHYSDTNYHLLAAIVEHVTGQPFDDVLRIRIVEPLGLQNTSMFGSPDAPDYDELATMYNKRQQIRFPLAMASVREDGGMVSTTDDLICFLRGLVDGALLRESPFGEQPWRRVFFPIDYGLGVMRIRIPRLMALGGRSPTLYGHGGASGTVAFFDPTTQMLIAGTLNQIAYRSRAYQLMLRLMQSAR
jgi:D-alanyl-D-alanine carboxypeptidase